MASRRRSRRELLGGPECSEGVVCEEMSSVCEMVACRRVPSESGLGATARPVNANHAQGTLVLQGGFSGVSQQITRGKTHDRPWPSLVAPFLQASAPASQWEGQMRELSFAEVRAAGPAARFMSQAACALERGLAWAAS